MDFLTYAMACENGEWNDSLPELLCEDGFLSEEELREADTPGRGALLLKRAVLRGFLIRGRGDATLSSSVRLQIKRNDSARVWKYLISRAWYLRAPPGAV